MRAPRRDEAFEAYFDAVFPRAVSLANRLLGDRASAEDVAAEAFARAYARWPTLRDAPWRDGWVLRVTTNRAIDVARRRSGGFSPHRQPDAGDLVAVRLALVAALRSLPQRQREAVALRYLTGLSEHEVAESLGVSLGTVKTHIHRGVASLRSCLGDDFGEEVTRLDPVW